MNKVYVVYEDWRDREYPPEILGVYADKRDADVKQKKRIKELEREGVDEESVIIRINESVVEHTLKKKNFYKLAQLIKLAAEDISREDEYCKTEDVTMMLGMTRSDSAPGIIEVKDDSGYRSIVIGDTRGTVSLDTGKPDIGIKHKGYMLIYSENCNYIGEKDVWKYRCFPSVKEISERLYKVACYESLIPSCINCDSDEYWYDNNTEESRKYLGDFVRECAERIGNDPRTAKEIFNLWI